MKLNANIAIIGKVAKPWTDSNGTDHLSYSINIMQENGQIVDTLRVSKEQFEKVEAGKTYSLFAEYGTGKNGPYLRILDISSEK